MKTCVVHLTKVNGSMQASARVARFLSDVLKLPLIDDLESLTAFEKSLPRATKERDVTIVFVNGPIAFCGYRDELGALLLPRVKRVFWAQQDYTIALPPNQAYSRPTKAETPFRAEFHKIPHVHLWSTCQDVLFKRATRMVPGSERDKYVNWNALTYAPIAAPPPARGSLFYYGALREDRKAAIKQLLRLDPAESRVVISLSNANAKLTNTWRELVGDGPQLTGLYKGVGRPRKAQNGNKWGEQLLLDAICEHEHSLYIADAASNLAFHSLANRFYEVLSTPRTVLWLDRAGACTYEKAGLTDWEQYSVGAAGELEEKLRLPRDKLVKLAAAQRKMWLHEDPFKALLRQVRQLGKTLGD